ncbi:MAG: hypothetical protein ACYTDT_11200, partial [Planctomycetota bacterium]
MGILDWLFGRKKNEYGDLNKEGSVKKRSPGPYSDSPQSSPAQHQQSEASAPQRTQPGFQNEGFQPPSSVVGTYFRRRRNKHPQDPIVRTYFKTWEKSFQWR